MRGHILVRIILVSVLSTVVSATAFAQYGGGTGGGTGGGMGSGTGGGTGGGTTSSTYMAPSGGYSSGKAIGIGVGVAAAVVVGVVLYIHHRHKAASSHNSGSLTDRTLWDRSSVSLPMGREHQISLPIATHTDLSVGERVELTGLKAQDNAGDLTARGRDLVKDYGTLSVPSR